LDSQENTLKHRFTPAAGYRCGCGFGRSTGAAVAGAAFTGNLLWHGISSGLLFIQEFQKLAGRKDRDTSKVLEYQQVFISGNNHIRVCF